MADTKVSALTAVTTPVGTFEIPGNEGGASKKLTLAQVNAYCEPLCNAAVATQTPAATDTYVTGSGITVPTARLQAKTLYRCRVSVTKTAAGVVAPIFNLRYGTAGSTADTSRGALTLAAQTAVIDTGYFEVIAVFNTVGSGTSAVIRSHASCTHQLATTGLSIGGGGASAVSGGFDSTVAGSILGLSVTPGTSAAWTINTVIAELINLL